MNGVRKEFLLFFLLYLFVQLERMKYREIWLYNNHFRTLDIDVLFNLEKKKKLSRKNMWIMDVVFLPLSSGIFVESISCLRKLKYGLRSIVQTFDNLSKVKGIVYWYETAWRLYFFCYDISSNQRWVDTTRNKREKTAKSITLYEER